jgi:hypothetical protein
VGKGKPKGKDKRPYAAFNPSASKTPRVEERTDSNRECPSWRIQLLEVVDPFGWHAIERDKLLEVREKLGQFESRTWNEIVVVAKKNNHAVRRDQLCKEAQDRLRQLKLDDIDELTSLRLSGAERVWGIRDNAIMMVLWWDPDHLVCPSEKKHT